MMNAFSAARSDEPRCHVRGRYSRMLVLVALGCAPQPRHAGTAGTSGSGPRPEARIVDIMPRFWEFRELTRSADSATARAQFHRIVIGPDSNVYRSFSDGPSDATLARYLRGVAKYEAAMHLVHGRLRADLPDYLHRFDAAFPDARWDSTTFYIMPWFFISDAGGGSAPTTGRVMIFGVDGIARARGANADLAPLFFHELFHVYQSAVNPGADDPARTRARTPLYELLWNEGLATYVSGRLSPASLPADVIMDTASLRQTKSRLSELARDVRVHLDSTSQRTFMLYMSAAARADAEPPPRSGYYIGMLVAQELAKTHSPSELARLRGPGLRTDIEAVLRKLEAAAGSGAAPPILGVDVTSVVPVTDSGRAAVEPFIAADPLDPSRLIISVSEIVPQRRFPPSASASGSVSYWSLLAAKP
jgi:hypothetical protein